MPIVLKPHELKLRQQAGEYDEPACIRGASGVYYGTEEPEDYQINVWVNPEGTVTKTMESPILTGIPTAPTASPHTNTTQIATTEFVMNEVENKIESTDIVDNLTTNDSSKPLSAAQGYVLNNNKVNKTDIADNLTTNDATKVLSAAQGYVLKNEVDGLDEEKAPKQNPVFTGSISLGRKTNTTTGTNSFAVGASVTASGSSAHAEGVSSTASGNASHAEGSSTEAFGLYSHTEGNNSHAYGQNAHAEGDYTRTYGSNSHVEGSYTVATEDMQHVFGKYNIPSNMSAVSLWTANTDYKVGEPCKNGGTYYICKTDHTSSSTFDSSKWDACGTNDTYVEIVGNGASNTARANARALDWDGNEYLKGDLYVGCNADSTGGEKVATEEYADSKVTYVTPEDFGAKGDGVADDTTAIQAAITEAVSKQVAVRGYKQYKTTSPISVSTNFLDLYLRSVTYTGNNCGISISGSYNNIEFGLLYCASGKAIVMDRPSGKSCAWNKVTAQRIFAHDHAVYFDTHNTNYILYNTFDIRVAKSEIGNCFHGDDFVAENVYTNTTCFCENGWAVYRCAGRFYNLTWEVNVLNGAYLTAGSCYFSGCRYRELVDKMVYYINGTAEYNGGTLIKIVGGDYLILKFVGDDVIPYECIDVTEMTTPEGLAEDYAEASTSAEKSTIASQLARLAFVKVVDAPIRIGNWDTKNGYFVPAKRMFVQSGRKYCIPYHETEYTITEANYDMSDSNFAINNAKIYPTKMIIGVDSCVVHLSPSYSPVGYSQFIVDQTSHTCTIYDSNNSVTPIFNGSTLGSGVYRLTAYADVSSPTVDLVDPSAHRDQVLFDGSNYTWHIERIDNTGGGSDCGVANIKDFGAVGDGTTDDSTAFQTAVNACDDLYLESNKTYYLGSEVTINNSIRIHGGKNTIIKTKTPSGGVVNNGIIAQGTLKLTTTLSSNYVAYGNSGDNIGNKLTLESDSNVAIGDIIVVQATDQYYSYARQYYYLGAAMLITDMYNGSIYVNEGMPFDITKTANLTVKVYSAPKVVFENIRFESDHTSGSSGAYIYPLTISRCRMPEVRNCSFANANNGLLLRECYGALVENVTVEKIKEDNTVGYDGYGCAVYGCMNTTFRKVTGQGGQSTIDLSGTITNINTWIKECDLMGECRTGLGMHENAYNTVVEDSIIAGATMYGTVTFNRCTFVENLKLTGVKTNVSFRGSHNPEWAKIKFKDCVFPKGDSSAIVLSVPACQTPIQSFDSVIGRVEIINCEGGRLQYNSTLDQYILSSKVKELFIDGWKDCHDIYHTDPNTIDVCIIRNSTFTHSPWMDKHTTAFWLDGVSILRRINDYPQMDRLLVKLARGGRFYLPEDVNISFSSSDTSARYLVCGENIASNNPADYNIGGLSGSAGEVLTKTVNSNFSNALSNDSFGNLVLTYPNATSSVAIYPTCMAYIKERSVIKMTCKLVNSGSTSASSFRACLCIIDAKTGNIVYRSNGQSAEATMAGVVVTHERDVPEDSLVFGYLQCYSGVALSETTFEDFAVKVLPVELDEGAISFTPYAGSSITGDGTIKSLNGQNNIMADSSSAFAVSFRADLLKKDQPVNANGVSF